MTTFNGIELFTSAEYKALDKQSRRKAYSDISNLLDEAYASSSDMWDILYQIYNWYVAIDDEEYREENMDAFRAYEARMNEEDFDWGYYSDWHKDMFGYRPHYKVIPETEAERERMFEAFHRARGL